MMRKVLLQLMTLIILSSFVIYKTRNSDGMVCGIDYVSFKVGEQATFKVYYHWGLLWIPAGEVTFNVRKGEYYGIPVYHFYGEGRTYKSYEWFYKVRDVYESWVDTATFKPYKFRRDVYEGGYTLLEELEFDYKRNKVWSRRDRQPKPEPFDINPCTYDVMTAMYIVRSIDFSDLEPGDSFVVEVFLDKGLYKIPVYFVGREILKTDHGKFRTIVFEPTLIAGTIFKEGAKMRVWATDDKNHLVLQVASPIIVGEIRAEIKSFKNLKYPLTSRIDDS
ncbi:MAG: DUF3108 domain-containing protein [Chlorobi bacterium]|nr:DUF3108 domain-containing protein [Chlorobiota bacterium]